MRPRLWMALLGVSAFSAVAAEEPPPAAKDDACLTLNNRILGPRSADRPLPLLRGDAGHGFHTACPASWSTLSPGNRPLPVIGCFQGSLLQVENDGACGPGTGPLWVDSRWVVTSAELAHPRARLVLCQQLETHAWAGTRDFKLDCEPRKKEPAGESAASVAPARPAAAAPQPPPAPPQPASADPAALPPPPK